VAIIERHVCSEPIASQTESATASARVWRERGEGGKESDSPSGLEIMCVYVCRSTCVCARVSVAV